MAMKVQKMQKILEYTVMLEPAEEGGYIVYVPALPGCVTQGDSVEEALKMAQDAIEGYLAVSEELMHNIPIEQAGAVLAKVPVMIPSAMKL